MNEKLLYDALARAMLQESEDEWGNKVSNPLRKALIHWVDKDSNFSKLTKEVSKNINIEELAELSAQKIKEELTSTYWKNNTPEKLESLVLEKVADILAKEKIEEMRNEKH